MTISDHPLHGSGRAVFPHPALASGDDAKSPQGIGVADTCRGQPSFDEPPHPLPENAAVLTTARQRTMPEPADLETEEVERRSVAGYAVVTDVPTNDRAQPLSLLRDGVVHASLELGFHRAQLRLQALANRLPQDREIPVASLLCANVREAEEAEGFRFALTASLAVFGRERSEFQEARLFGVQFQPSEVLPYVHGVSDRAGSCSISRYRCDRWGLPLFLTASAPRRKILSRLNTRPARTPVNASALPSRATPHDSGSVWVANPSPSETFIHYTSPV
jgi:hypothetical protein